jgi:prepilin-type processing-associated H-X9-DG protein
MTIQTRTLIRQVEADLRTAFPEVQFEITVPSWSKPGDRTVMIFWCGEPPDHAAVGAVTDKHAHRGVYLFLDGHVPCEFCGEPTYYIHDRAICVICEPALWGCGSEEEEVNACARLGLRRSEG